MDNKKTLGSEELLQKATQIKITTPYDDVQEKVRHIWQHGWPKGYDCGFKNLYQHYQILPGRSTLLYGAPFSGKSYVGFEWLLNLSQYHGLKHGVWSEEMGEPEEIYIELIGMYARNKNIAEVASKSFYEAEAFIRDHFMVISPDDVDIDADAFMDLPAYFEDKHNFKVDTLTGDPFNYFTLNYKRHGNARDLAIEDFCKTVNRKTKKLKIHTILVNHVRDQTLITETIKGVNSDKKFVYYPMPTARDVSGGQVWYRMGQNMIAVWRPPEGYPDQDGYPAASNEVHLEIQKFKPRWSGKRGIVKWYLDTSRQRYYELEGSDRQYASKIDQERDEETGEVPF